MNLSPHPATEADAVPSTRHRLIETALAIVAGQSISRLTLDEVARQTGLSKGGLLYHFKSKQALVGAMTSYCTERVGDLCERHHAALPPGPNRLLRAYVLATFEITAPGQGTLGPMMLAVTVHNPELIPPMEREFKRMMDRIRAESTDPDLVLLVAVAMDGLWLHNIFKLTTIGLEQRERLAAGVLAMIDAASAAQFVSSSAGAPP